MSSDQPSLEQKLQALRLNYLNGLVDRYREISEQWHLLQGNSTDHQLLETLHRLTHTMAGSGATFGCPEVGSAARRAESAFRQIIDDQRIISASDISAIDDLITHLGAEIEHSISRGVNEQGRSEVQDVIGVSDVIEPGLSVTNNLIYILEDEADVATDLETQIVQFGYRVSCFRSSEALLAAVSSERPRVIIADIMFPDNDTAGIDTMRTVQAEAAEPIPIIFISSSSDFNTRIESVRAGGVAYFDKPLDVAKLIDRLDAIVAEGQQEPFRVLIVEDSDIQAGYYAMILQQHGMMTSVVNDSMQLMQPLQSFNPDLVLMDMYMPDCSGLELATVIRQENEYVSLPIVFLSSESSLDKKLNAMSFGGDDFLTKPIKPNHLVSAVTSRVQRYRSMRSMMLRDSLTGLFNHTTIKEQLDSIISRAGRHAEQVVFAMVDIDHFKQVNDTHGHMVGDRVIKTISRLFKQRMRKSDVIGRYGGEEFAVILPDTTLEEAEKVFNNVREAFAKISYQSDQGEFSVTFSGGLAAFPDYQTANALNEAADKALYQAKDAGRNCIVKAQ